MAEDFGDGSAASAAADMEEYEMLMSTTDVELLKTAWRNEKAAPEILQFQAQLVKRAREQIQLMVVFNIIQNPKSHFSFVKISASLDIRSLKQSCILALKQIA